MKRMPDRPDTWARLAAWLEQNWPAIYSGLLAVVIASLRVIYGGGTVRRMVIEAPFAAHSLCPPVMGYHCWGFQPRLRRSSAE